MKKTKREVLLRDIDDVENALVKMGRQDGVWQNNLIRVLLRAVLHLLQIEVTR